MEKFIAEVACEDHEDMWGLPVCYKGETLFPKIRYYIPGFGVYVKAFMESGEVYMEARRCVWDEIMQEFRGYAEGSNHELTTDPEKARLLVECRFNREGGSSWLYPSGDRWVVFPNATDLMHWAILPGKLATIAMELFNDYSDGYWKPGPEWFVNR